MMEKSRTYLRYMTCADITFEISSPWPMTSETFHHRLTKFETSHPKDDKIRIEHIFSIPEYFHELSDENIVYQKILWTVFQRGTNWIYKKAPALPVTQTASIFMECSRDFSLNQIYCDCITPKEYANGSYSSASIFGCDQIIMSKLLSSRKGVLFHANGFVSNEKGYLLAGPSTSGKTTLSKMLKEKGFFNFSDDRAIVRFQNHQWLMQGSWFHGTTPVTSTGNHPLRGIFFLEHAKENTICPLSSSQEKIGHILQSLVRPHITAMEWGAMLETIGKMARDIPCYKLRFDLSGDIISKINKISDASII